MANDFAIFIKNKILKTEKIITITQTDVFVEEDDLVDFLSEFTENVHNLKNLLIINNI